MKKIAVILLAPGHKDGSEITEVICALLALSEFNVAISYFSFDEEFGSERNDLLESQRISRGQSQSIETLNPVAFDALVLPGGSGMLAKLSSWKENQENFKIHPALQKAILAFHQQSKPIGAICISPFLVAEVLKKYNPLITLGESSELIVSLKKMNIQHETCPSNDYITDRDCKLLTTPGYINENAKPFEIYTGIRSMIKELVEMA